MKIAKKMLAVVVALVMVAGLSAMAFAAGTPTIKVVPGEVVDGKVEVVVFIVDGEGHNSFDADIKFPADKLQLALDSKTGEPAVKNGKDARAVALTSNPLNMLALGNPETGVAKFAALFQNGGLTEFIDEDSGDAIDVDVNNFEIAKFTFEVKEGATGDIALEVEATTDGFVGQGATIRLGGGEEPSSEEPSSEEPSSEQPSSEKPSEEKPTDAANPNTGDNQDDKNTGDTVVIAVVAGVVALAGAAFIISKKRK